MEDGDWWSWRSLPGWNQGDANGGVQELTDGQLDALVAAREAANSALSPAEPQLQQHATAQPPPPQQLPQQQQQQQQQLQQHSQQPQLGLQAPAQLPQEEQPAPPQQILAPPPSSPAAGPHSAPVGPAGLLNSPVSGPTPPPSLVQSPQSIPAAGAAGAARGGSLPRGQLFAQHPPAMGLSPLAHPCPGPSLTPSPASRPQAKRQQPRQRSPAAGPAVPRAPAGSLFLPPPAQPLGMLPGPAPLPPASALPQQASPGMLPVATLLQTPVAQPLDPAEAAATEGSDQPHPTAADSADSGPVPAATGDEPPCSHNMWDNIRAKKECVTLRCRSCQVRWKACSTRLPRCPEFSATSSCPRAPTCHLIHIFRYKLDARARRRQSDAATCGRQDTAAETPAAPPGRRL
eukprot:TRINITY_DN4692_c0_g1_i2.p1 TRINITY_DN4692_c0_g1~~TRINITY_DN4692_c0_g1_i2.p1  ORF type:complete len:403 (+),score=95.97 TRINITY_DN4692_c0_g1_i2:131-1339(+)